MKMQLRNIKDNKTYSANITSWRNLPPSKAKPIVTVYWSVNLDPREYGSWEIVQATPGEIELLKSNGFMVAEDLKITPIKITRPVTGNTGTRVTLTPKPPPPPPPLSPRPPRLPAPPVPIGPVRATPYPYVKK